VVPPTKTTSSMSPLDIPESGAGEVGGVSRGSRTEVQEETRDGKHAAFEERFATLCSAGKWLAERERVRTLEVFASNGELECRLGRMAPLDRSEDTRDRGLLCRRQFFLDLREQIECVREKRRRGHLLCLLSNSGPDTQFLGVCGDQSGLIETRSERDNAV
jgi:hypothetical protein